MDLIPFYDALAFGCRLIPQRYALALLTSIGISIAFLQRLSFSIVLNHIVIQRDRGENISSGSICPEISSEEAKLRNLGEFDWSDRLQGELVTSYFYGYFISNIPGGAMADLYGFKYLLGGVVFLSSVFSLLTPIAARISPYFLMMVQVCMGLCQGPIFGAATAMVSNWAPPNERSSLNTVVNAGVPFGIFLGNLISGQLIEVISKWDYIFYLYFSFGAFWFIVWYFLAFDYPDDHPYMTDFEREYIYSSIAEESPMAEGGIPWLSILESRYVLMMTISNLGSDCGFYIISVELPLYLYNVLKFGAFTTGVVAGLPWLICSIGAVISGVLSDIVLTRGWFRKENIRKFNGILASGVPAVFIICASYSECNYTLVSFFFVLSMFFFGAYFSSIRVSQLDICPNFAGTIVSIVNCGGVLGAFIMPRITHTLIAGGGTLEEWHILFCVTAAILLLSLIPYMFITAQIQTWNEGTYTV